MFPSFSFAVSTAAPMNFVTVFFTAENVFVAACPTALFATESFISFTLFVTASFAFENAPVMVSLIALNFSLTLLHNSDNFSLTLSQFLYKAIPAAISPAISVTIKIIGHRFMTALRAVCATVIPPVTPVAVAVAAVCAASAAAPAVSAAVPDAVAAVLAVIFAMIPPTNDANC